MKHGLHLLAHGLLWLVLGDFEVGKGFSVTQAEPEHRTEAGSFVVTAGDLPAPETADLPSAYERAYRLSQRPGDRRPIVVWVGTWDTAVTEALPDLYHVRAPSFEGQPQGSVVVSAWRNGRLTWLMTLRDGTRRVPSVDEINRVLGRPIRSLPPVGLAPPARSFSPGNRGGNC